MFVGYVRVSHSAETLPLQQAALKQAGCERIVMDEVQRDPFEQLALQKALSLMQPGDTLVVWRLDRLGRSLQDVVQKVEELARRQIGLRSLQEGIDTRGPAGRYQLQAFSALAECQRTLLRERTKVGLSAARARGRQGGRKRAMTPEMVQLAAQLVKDPALDTHEICTELGVSRSTLYRYVGPNGEVRRR